MTIPVAAKVAVLGVVGFAAYELTRSTRPPSSSSSGATPAPKAPVYAGTETGATRRAGVKPEDDARRMENDAPEKVTVPAKETRTAPVVNLDAPVKYRTARVYSKFIKKPGRKRATQLVHVEIGPLHSPFFHLVIDTDRALLSRTVFRWDKMKNVTRSDIEKTRDAEQLVRRMAAAALTVPLGAKKPLTWNELRGRMEQQLRRRGIPGDLKLPIYGGHDRYVTKRTTYEWWS